MKIYDYLKSVKEKNKRSNGKLWSSDEYTIIVKYARLPETSYGVAKQVEKYLPGRNRDSIRKEIDDWAKRFPDVVIKDGSYIYEFKKL